MIRCMNVDEARGVGKDRAGGVLAPTSMGKRCEFMFACLKESSVNSDFKNIELLGSCMCLWDLRNGYIVVFDV